MTGLLRSVFAAAPLNLCGMLAQRMRFAPLTCHGIFNIRVVGCWAHARRKFDEALHSLLEQWPYLEDGRASGA